MKQQYTEYKWFTLRRTLAYVCLNFHNSSQRLKFTLHITAAIKAGGRAASQFSCRYPRGHFCPAEAFLPPLVRFCTGWLCSALGEERLIVSFWNFLLTGQQNCKADSTIKYDKVFFKTLTVWLLGEKKKKKMAWFIPGCTSNRISSISCVQGMIAHLQPAVSSNSSSQKMAHLDFLTLKHARVSHYTFSGQKSHPFLCHPPHSRVSSQTEEPVLAPCSGQPAFLNGNIMLLMDVSTV